MYCKEARCQLLEITLEAEVIPQHGPLGEHLRDCPACRAFLARILRVDAALHALPLEAAPPELAQYIMAQIPALPLPEKRKFLSWTLWLPVVSLFVGVFWAYLTLLWSRGAEISNSVDPTMANWLTQLEHWLANNQAILSAAAISVTVGLLLTVLAVAVGLYVGRERAATSH